MPLSLNTLQQFAAGYESLAALFVDIEGGEEVLAELGTDVFQSRRGGAVEGD